LNEDIANKILEELQKLREENSLLKERIAELSWYPKSSLQSLSQLAYREPKVTNIEGLSNDTKARVDRTVEMILQYARKVGFT
jgi:hypothetical protein